MIEVYVHTYNVHTYLPTYSTRALRLTLPPQQGSIPVPCIVYVLLCTMRGEGSDDDATLPRLPRLAMTNDPPHTMCTPQTLSSSEEPFSPLKGLPSYYWQCPLTPKRTPTPHTGSVCLVLHGAQRALVHGELFSPVPPQSRDPYTPPSTTPTRLYGRRSP